MGWFGRKREAQDANEILRQYNAAEAARLAGMTEGASPGAASPVTLSGAVGDGEIAVEDVFTITGRGLVVTGKVSSGVLRIGDAVSIIRDGATISTTEVTGIEMFRKRTTEATRGDMVGLLLRGSNDVARGDVIRVTGSA